MSARRWGRAMRTPVGLVGLTLLTIVVLLAVFAPILWHGRADAVDTSNILAGPSREHWLGTDALGRDLFYRVLVATRLTVLLAVSATVIATVIGLLLGAAPLLLGRRAGSFVGALINIMVAFPGLLLVLFFAVVFGVGAKGAVLAIGLAGAPFFGRLCQTLMAGITSRDFVAAARIAGVGRFRILLRHVLPNIAEPLVVNITIGAGAALLAFAGLSFLGLGVQPPAYDWGQLMQQGLSGIYVHPVAALAPGVAVILAGLAFNLTGEAIARGFGVQATGNVPLEPETDRGELAPPATEHVLDTDDDPDVVLDVRELRVTFPGAAGPIRPVRGISFRVRSGQAVGLVGESGSGKSLTALAVSQLVEEPGRVEADRLSFVGTDLLDGKPDQTLLGQSLSVVFQDPMTTFNPAHRMGPQLAEVARQHQGLGRRAALARAVDRLRAVKVSDPERRARQYPFEFSGGMCQRAMIGMGLMGTPRLIIADEPTTALDVTVQQQILGLLAAIRRDDDVALLLISHDVAVVAQVCDRVLVMYAGRIVEELPAADLWTAAKHPYTCALVAAVPDMATDLDAPLASIPGRPVDPAEVPVGCAYAARCPLADDRCRTTDPELRTDAAGNRVACWHPGEMLTLGQTVTIDEALAR
jgi:oligopeptide/dipeptide ABC transporter ATP-binding protein